jgi:hypothetical protein
VIAQSDFEKLRLRSFVDEVVDLDHWQFMGREWIGEAVGFTEWLRPKDDPARLGSLAVDLVNLPWETTEAILDRLGLPLRAGMTLEEVTAVLGVPSGTQEFVPGRKSHDFEFGSADRYSVSCTVHDSDGLTYLVVAPAPHSQF